MSGNFDKNLAIFLTECKESAIKELIENNSDYKKLLAETAKFSKTIQKTLPDDYEALTDAFQSLARMEMNHLYLQGFKDCINLYKRFDGSFMGSQNFEKFFIE